VPDETSVPDENSRPPSGATSPSTSPDSPRPLSPREYRDTEPLAIWGFVLAFLFAPAGLVVSYVALKRVRRTGDGGWGLSVAGLALSTIVVVPGLLALLALFFRSGTVEAWSDSVERSMQQRTVASVTSDLAEELVDDHAERDAWAMSLMEVAAVEDGMLRGVAVEAYRNGDEICVEGTRGDVVGSSADDEFRKETCAARGFAGTLRAVASREAAATEAAEETATAEQALADVLERGEETAAASSLREPRDLGLLSVPEVDLMACALVAGNRGYATDEAHLTALATTFRERVADVGADYGLENAAYDLEQAAADLGSEERYYLEGEALLRADFACWHGGYDGPGPEPVFPALWTTPLSAEDAEVNRLWPTMTDEERAPYNERWVVEEEQAQVEMEAILEEYYR